MFKIGEKVVCISNLQRDEADIHYGIFFPIQNEIYTIREFFKNDAIRLVEIVNPILKYKDGVNEQAFLFKHFRKLDYQFAEDLLANITEQVKEELIYPHRTNRIW